MSKTTKLPFGVQKTSFRHIKNILNPFLDYKKSPMRFRQFKDILWGYRNSHVTAGLHSTACRAFKTIPDYKFLAAQNMFKTL